MSRTALAVAETSLTDLWEAFEAFDDLQLLFKLIKERSPEGSPAFVLADAGFLVTDSVGVKFLQYASCMEDELDQLRAPEVATPSDETANGVATGEGGQ